MKITNSRQIWAGDSWRLRVDTLTGANGRTLEKGIIEHPGAVVLIPLLPNGDVLMIRQYRHAIKQTILELPAGTRGWDEDWLACGQRELREETGHRADQLTRLGQIWPAPGLSSELMALFLAEGLHPDPLPQDDDEEIEVTPLPLADLLPMARDGRLHDAKTIIGIWHTAVHLGMT